MPPSTETAPPPDLQQSIPTETERLDAPAEAGAPEPSVTPVAETIGRPAKPPRLMSLDAYRGFIMLAMASGGLGFAQVVRGMWRNVGELFAGSAAGPLHVLPWLQHEPAAPTDFWRALAYQFDHVQWAGCSFWDLIQPSFMFMVGVAVPYSYASRQARGESSGKIATHVLFRCVILVLLGVFLSSNSARQTNWTFVNVLSQIGLGYAFLYLFLNRGLKVQLGALAVILVVYWFFFALYPLPSEAFATGMGVRPAWLEQHGYTGLFAHWNKNTNAAAAFDLWFLNLFPRAKPFEFNDGGYQTLNFIPSFATMLLGLMAGELLRGPRSDRQKFHALVLAGVNCLLLGWLLDHTICPSVKRIWTPAWAIFSTGWTFWMLAGFYWLIDLQGWKAWAFPLIVVGMNSIAIYCMAQLMKSWVRDTIKTHVGQGVYQGAWFGGQVYDPIYAPIAESLAVLFVFWLICLWMYRRKIFLKI